jgi:hypothetical protein
MTWNPDTLTTLGDAEEVGISSTRPDGTLRPYVTIWGVRVGDDFYVRTGAGGGSNWFRRATASGAGSVRAGSVEQPVTFEAAAAEALPAVDAEYSRKYARYPSSVAAVVGEKVHDVTLRLVPTA